MTVVDTAMRGERAKRVKSGVRVPPEMNEPTQMPMAAPRPMGVAGSCANQADTPPKSANALRTDADPSTAMAGTATMDRMVSDLIP